MNPSYKRTAGAVIPWAVFLLVGGVTAFVPTTGWASCGDYLAMPGHEHARAHRLLGDPVPAEMPQRPCQGPHCRQAPPPTAPMTPVGIEHTVEHGAFLPNLDAITLYMGETSFAAPLLNAGASHPLSIDRPPR